MRTAIIDSPVESLRKTLPQGDANWPSFGHVWSKLQEAAHYLASQRYMRLGDDHIRIMAVMGTGNEELMKGELMRCYSYNWCKAQKTN